MIYMYIVHTCSYNENNILENNRLPSAYIINDDCLYFDKTASEIKIDIKQPSFGSVCLLWCCIIDSNENAWRLFIYSFLL